MSQKMILIVDQIMEQLTKDLSELSLEDQLVGYLPVYRELAGEPKCRDGLKTACYTRYVWLMQYEDLGIGYTVHLNAKGMTKIVEKISGNVVAEKVIQLGSVKLIVLLMDSVVMVKSKKIAWRVYLDYRIPQDDRGYYEGTNDISLDFPPMMTSLAEKEIIFRRLGENYRSGICVGDLF